MKTSRRKLDQQEVGRAIYFDYEGNTKRAPTLLGWRIDGQNSAAIIEPAFSTCAERFRAKDVALQDHAWLARRLIELADKEDRLLVSWSEHDLKQMSSVLDPSWQDRLIGRYRNAIPTARAWHYKTLGVSCREATLDYFSGLAGFQVPEKFGQGIVGEGLRLIREQIENGRSYADLTPRAGASWVAIVKHNRYDLEAMEFVLRVVTSGGSRAQRSQT